MTYAPKHELEERKNRSFKVPSGRFAVLSLEGSFDRAGRSFTSFKTSF
jgi:hypothetical protein